MTDWGRHGAATADLWDRFFRTVVTPTAAFADGAEVHFNGLPSATYFKYEQEPAVTVMTRWHGETMPYPEDQAVIFGGPWVDTRGGIRPTAAGVYGSVATNAQKIAIAERVWGEEITQLQYPWRFYKFGQQYLARLLAVKPPLSASLEQRMVWAVDVAWWVNMMLASTNVYPSWIPDTLGKLLGGNAWRVFDYVPLSNDLGSIPELSPRVGGYQVDPGFGFYPMPFAQHPGQLNTSGALRNRLSSGAWSSVAAPSLPMLSKLRRWAAARPWWLGIQTYGAVEAAQRRAAAEDPRMDANLLRAVMQHSFFSETGTDRAGDFFETIAWVRAKPSARDALETFTEHTAPAWLAAMQMLPYWQIVRAGADSWSYYSSGIDVRVDSGRLSVGRFPMTAVEARTLKHEYEMRKDDALVMSWVVTLFQTAYAVVLAYATGTVGNAQLDALRSWYDRAYWKYREPKIWERAWEVPPIVVRMSSTHGCLVEHHDSMCSTTPYGPDSRLDSVGSGLLYAGAALKKLSERGGIALTKDAALVAPASVVAFEAATDQVPRRAPDPSAPAESSVPVTTEPLTPWAPQTFTRQVAGTPLWLWASAGALAVVGIIVTTRNRSR